MSAKGVIVVGGEALYDLVLDDSMTLAAHAGGGPFNTARTIARLQQPVAFLGRLSRDRFGQRLGQLLTEDGVSLEAVVHTNDPTTLALAELDEDRGARYRFYAQGTSAPGLSAADALAALPHDVSALHVGTLGLVLEPIATALAAVVERLAGRVLIAVDPNCRSSAIPDPVAYRERLKSFLHHSDVIKVSEEDAVWLAPERAPVDAARELLAPGTGVALLTRGSDGAVVVTRQTAIPVPAPPTQVADTIGAGDAFCGGFLAWWRREGLGRASLGDLDAVVEATRFGCLVAALTCERPGASPPKLTELGSLPTAESSTDRGRRHATVSRPSRQSDPGGVSE